VNTLDPKTQATDSRVYGRVRDERSRAETVQMPTDTVAALIAEEKHRHEMLDRARNLKDRMSRSGMYDDASLIGWLMRRASK
jgi:tRNA A37 threonylcarbamoyladenosine synthetase subunit TsaC/SUA5/YrdC